ncbi:histone deacetylase family protein [Planctomycetaceae bacterium SH139]
MTLLYFDECFTEHETGRHPENPARILAIGEQLQKAELFTRCQRPAWQPAAAEAQHRAHTTDYTHRLQALAAAGGGQIEQDTVLSAHSFEVSCLAAGAACDAVSRVLAGEDKTAFCAIRPPGHHALANAAMGFCLLNNVAVAAHHALTVEGLDRVLIVDWDVHHGNGTQAIFWEDPRVGFFSIHRWPFYPGTGSADETGSGAGLGTTWNVPVAYGTTRTAYHQQFAATLQRSADQLRPQLILISAGFDAHRHDPIGSLGLETEDFQTLTKAVLEVAQQHAEGRVVSLLEGGYHPAALAASTSLHVQTLSS